jgi:tRNA pseudouridine38-40 synthase
MSRSCARNPRPRASTRAATRSAARTATACSRGARAACGSATALWVAAPLDADALRECARALVGRHDFTAFTPTETEHTHFVSEVSRAEWRCEGELFEFWIEADKFLRHMNRALVGTMLDVARDARPLEEFTELLAGRPRAHAGGTAPAHGLALARVRYPEA